MTWDGVDNRRRQSSLKNQQRQAASKKVVKMWRADFLSEIRFQFRTRCAFCFSSHFFPSCIIVLCRAPRVSSCPVPFQQQMTPWDVENQALSTNWEEVKKLIKAGKRRGLRGAGWGREQNISDQNSFNTIWLAQPVSRHRTDSDVQAQELLDEGAAAMTAGRTRRKDGSRKKNNTQRWRRVSVECWVHTKSLNTADKGHNGDDSDRPVTLREPHGLQRQF